MTHVPSNRRWWLSAPILTLLLIPSAQAPAAPRSGTNVVTQWADTMLEAVAATKSGPTVTSRAIAIVQTAEFDAWAAYDKHAVGVYWASDLHRPRAERTDDNKAATISYAAYDALVDLFPSQTALFDARLASLGLPPSSSTDVTTPAGIGNQAAAWELAARHADGSNQLGDLHAGAYSDYTGYVPVNTATTIVDPSRWQPITFNPGTPQAVTPKYLTPQWGLVQTFSLPSGDALRPPAPLAYGSPGMLSELADVMNFTANLTDLTKVIAETWAGGPGTVTPPGFWLQIAEYVSQRDHFSVDKDVKMFFLVGNALMDAGITCWDSKRAYDSSRPWTAVHDLFVGQVILGWGGSGVGTVPMLGENWRPYQPLSFITPPFPEHVSGHSTFSAAAAEVLKGFTGSDAFGGSLLVPAGAITYDAGAPSVDVLLSWPTFTDAAEQAGMSRLFGGIHYMAANLEGQALGRQVGQAVLAKAELYFNFHNQLP